MHRGQSLKEYFLIIALIGFVCIGSVLGLGGRLSELFSGSVNQYSLVMNGSRAEPNQPWSTGEGGDGVYNGQWGSKPRSPKANIPPFAIRLVSTGESAGPALFRIDPKTGRIEALTLAPEATDGEEPDFSLGTARPYSMLTYEMAAKTENMANMGINADGSPLSAQQRAALSQLSRLAFEMSSIEHELESNNGQTVSGASPQTMANIARLVQAYFKFNEIYTSYVGNASATSVQSVVSPMASTILSVAYHNYLTNAERIGSAGVSIVKTLPLPLPPSNYEVIALTDSYTTYYKAIGIQYVAENGV